MEKIKENNILSLDLKEMTKLFDEAHWNHPLKYRSWASRISRKKLTNTQKNMMKASACGKQE